MSVRRQQRLDCLGRIVGLIALVLCVLYPASRAEAQGLPGLDSRPANDSCLALPRPPASAMVALPRVFPALTFAQPVGLSQVPGDNARFYVVEQGGRVRTFLAGAAGATTFLDLTDRVVAGGERGLLGLAFHPDYPATPLVYISYTGSGGASRLSRFSASPAQAVADPGSETVLLTQAQPFANHNGGQIAFGPDGYLYLSLGDGGSAGDPQDNAQNIENKLGAILRLDVDRGLPYAIPPDNPFAASPGCGSGQGCPEIFAWGLRNPWRFSFDAASGQLWAGDVGQNAWEEVDVIEAGGNYGWRCFEGTHPFNQAGCGPASGYVPPVAEYPHAGGDCSVTGGFVYRGEALPFLRGTYVFADYCSGTLRGLFDQGGQLVMETLAESALNISSFGQDNAGELYALDHAGGGIYRLAQAGGVQPVPFPQSLSETGLVDPGAPWQVNPCFIPYEVNSPLWSDGAAKRRWLAVPDGSFIGVGADGDFELPVGSVLVKEFSLNGRRIETRLFMRHEDGGWAGYSFEWTDDGHDALLLPAGKTKVVDGQTWVFPGRAECLTCHTAAAGRTLGLELAQLNRTAFYPTTGRTANQLFTFEHIGLFSAPLPAAPEDLPALADPADVARPVLDRARSYLHANCAICHRPGGTARGQLDLRFSVPEEAMNLCGVAPSLGELGIPGALLLAPGLPSRSVFLARMQRLDETRMPPLASTVVDTAGVAMLADWVLNTMSCTFSSPLTGWWWNAAAPGTGLSVAVQGTKLFAGWYVYDVAGRPVWYVGLADRAQDGSYSGSLVRATGTPLGQPYLGYQAAPAGTFRLRFPNEASAVFDYTLGAVAGSLGLTRLFPAIAPGPGDPRSLTGWWWDPRFEGLGFFLEAGGGTLFAAWYHYREDRSARWWSLGGGHDVGGFPPGALAYAEPFREWSGGQVPGGAWRLPTFIGRGGAELTFGADGRAGLVWNGLQYNLEPFVFINF